MYSLDITDTKLEEGMIEVREILHNDRLMTTEHLKDIINLLNEIEKIRIK